MVFPHTRTTKSAEETAAVGRELAAYLKIQKRRGQALPLCLYGELGSGKTTFTRGFAKELGIKTRLLSPTFIIVRRYQLSKPFFYFYHIDLYRMQSKEGLEGLGVADILSDNSAFVAIEWAEKLGTMLPESRIDIELRVEDDGHSIEIVEVL